MTNIEYTHLRETAGPRPDAAATLGISARSLSRRENGDIHVTPEMELAMEQLAYLKTHVKFIPGWNKKKRPPEK
jgi:DNA-binding XRE family transcriptional regulator